MAKKPQDAQHNQHGKHAQRGQQQKRGGKAQDSRPTHTPAAPVRPWRPGRDKFLPVSRADMDARGWDQCDFVYICGDAYVDHPSFGMAIISRVLDAHGYKVGIICQPDWTDPASITVLGEPRLGFLVSAGNMDSMVNHYSVTKHRRHTDAYTPGGEEGRRPNRAVTVYGNLIRQTFKDAPIIIGGIEASLRQLPGVKKVFVRSGIRFDYTMADASDEFLRELLEHHVSGQLRVAPEHVSDAVLSVMGKPSRAVYDAFCRKFERLNREYGLKQYVVPYLISSHPGSTMKEAVDLAEAVRDMGYMPEQVQDFYPTPSTMSTCMYYTGVDPRTMEPIYVARDPHEKAMQRALIQYRKPENYKLVREALEKAGRRDLIGYTKHCLIRPVPPRPGETSAGGGHGTGKKGGKPHGGAAGKGPKGSKGHGGMSRAQNTAGRNRAAQGRQGANGGGRRN